MSDPDDDLDHDAAFLAIVDALRENKMGWIVEEIFAEVDAGEVIASEFLEGKSKKQGFRFQPYVARQRLTIALRIVHQRINVALEAWVTAKREMAALAMQPVLLDVDQFGNATEIEPFSTDVSESLRSFDLALDAIVDDQRLMGEDVDRMTMERSTADRSLLT